MRVIIDVKALEENQRTKGICKVKKWCTNKIEISIKR